MKIGDEIYVRGTVDEIRKDIIIIKNNGGYFGTVIDEIVESPQGNLIEQIKWERDVAIEQLKELGYGLGEKPRILKDVVEKQTVIDTINDELDRIDHVPQWVYDRLERRVQDLPSAQPKRPTGHWIPVDSHSAFGGDEATWMAHGNPIAYYYCSNCKQQARADEEGKDILSNFCPDCGADMRGEQNESN